MRKPPRESAQYGEKSPYEPVDLLQEYNSTLVGLNATLKYIDSSLELCNRLLDISQPNEPGRVLIVWWKTGKLPHLNPVPVVLKKAWIPGMKSRPVTSGGQVSGSQRRPKDWYLEKVSVRGLKLRAKQGGNFGESYETTSAILAITKELLEHREYILRKARIARSQLEKIQTHRQSRSESLFARLRDYFVLFAKE